MGFFAPWFLAGVAAIGLPVYLHLLRRHTTLARPFSSLMFFEPRTQTAVKHRRLRYLALLALRVALLTLIALAFANPFIARAPAMVHHDRLTMIVIDDSFSMRAGTRLEDAKREALAVLRARHASDPVQVLALDAQLHALTQPTRDSGTARAAIESVQPGDRRSSFGELARAVRLAADSARLPIDLHVFSDMQRSSLAPSFTEMVLPDSVTLVPHPVAKSGTPVPNWTVESVTAPARVWGPSKSGTAAAGAATGAPAGAATGAPAGDRRAPASPAQAGRGDKRVQAVIAGYGTPAATRTATLTVNGRIVATQSVQVPAGGRASVEFPALDVPYGFSRCEVRIDAADSLPADDGYVFSVERTDPQRVLFVHTANDTRSPLYFGHALGAAAESAFDLQSVSIEQATNLSLAQYAFVVLSNVPSVQTSFERDLLAYVREGGSLFIAVGTAAAGRGRVPVFGEGIQTVHDYSRELARGRERFLSVGESDPSHLAIGKTGTWPGVRFYYAVSVDPANARVVARLTDRTPLLLDKPIGEGRVLLFASGLDNLTNDFPLHPAFVAFVEQTARYLSGAERRGGARRVDAFLELRTAREQNNSASTAGTTHALGVEVIDPSGHRPLSLTEAGSTQSFQLTQAGFYRVRLANGREDVVGVNPDRRESNLDVMPDDVLASWRGGPQQATRAAAAADAPEQQEPYSLWWYIMILALAAALSESWLASRYLGAQREDHLGEAP
jgi:hypothetical protein